MAPIAAARRRTAGERSPERLGQADNVAMDVVLANPRGFCAGVDRAIEIVKRALELFGAPIYVRHEVVHNRFVVDELKHRGAIFVDELDEVPDDATVIFSAHGVSQAVRAEAARRGLKVFDATCPLVTKVHLEVARQCRAGRDMVLVGHAGHPEVEGTMGQWQAHEADRPAARGTIYLVEDLGDVATLAPGQPDNIAYTTQTTLSVDDTRDIIAALRARFPAIQGPRNDDICYATQNRQDAVRELTRECDLVLVVGSPNSSNSNRLRELAEREGVEAHLIDGAAEIDPRWLEGRRHVGVTAGASAPDVLVQGVLDRLRALGAGAVRELRGEPEDMVFALPRELRIVLV
jgi:4-hydroxy-3-methylbut-2-enyl diphosphate reductase